MTHEEMIETLKTKGKELSEFLKNNFDPYAAIIITDTEVKVVRTELGCPIDYRMRE